MNKKNIIKTTTRMPVLLAARVEEPMISEDKLKLFEEFVKSETRAASMEGTEDEVDKMLADVMGKEPDEQLEVFRILQNRFLQSSNVSIGTKVMEVILETSNDYHPILRLEAFKWAHTVVENKEMLWKHIKGPVKDLLMHLVVDCNSQYVSYVLAYVEYLLHLVGPEEEETVVAFVCLLMRILSDKEKASEDFRYRSMLAMRLSLPVNIFTVLMREMWDCRTSMGTESRILWCRWLESHPLSYDHDRFPKELIQEFLRGILESREKEAPCHVADAASLVLDITMSEENNLKTLAEDVLRDYYESGVSGLYSSNHNNSKTFYENQENVHCIAMESAQEILDFLAEDFPIRPRHRLQYYLDWIEEAFAVHLNLTNDKEKVRLAMYRIDKDWSQHGRHRHRLYDIFQMVVAYIDRYGDKETDHCRKDLQQRLLEELEDMAGTCSTGYAVRLLNVLTGYRDFQIRIPPEYALRCRFFQLINRCIIGICDIDPERGARIMDQMTLPPNLFEKRSEFLSVFREKLPTIKEDLYKEFKDMMTDTDYDFYLRKAIFSYEGLESGF